jgi:hypothetical protein
MANEETNGAMSPVGPTTQEMMHMILEAQAEIARAVAPAAKPPEPPSLAARIVAAMADVGSIAKAGRNKDQGYAYQKAADIFEATQEAFAKQGVLLIPDEDFIEWPDPLVTRVRADGSGGTTMFICRCRMLYTLRDVISGETIAIKSTGLAYDTSDKALNKAKTFALKTFLKQMLLIGEEEDDGDAEHLEPAPEPPCPSCGVVGAIIKGKPEYGGGWLCFGKKGGCGAKFLTDPREAQKAETKGETVDTSTSQEKPRRQARNASPASTSTEPPKEAAASVSEPAAAMPEMTDNEALDLQILIEQTQFPGGLAKVLAMFGGLANLKELPAKQRKQLAATLSKRQAMIDSGEIVLEPKA